MKRVVAVLCLAAVVSGCASQRVCTHDITVYNEDGVTTRVTKVERPCPDDNSVKWYEVLLFPVFALAAASDVQRGVVSSPHYQAGGSSYRDYTLPQNQPR